MASSRGPGGSPPTLTDALQQAQNLVDNSQYHNANDLVDAIAASAPKHPNIDAEDIDDLHRLQGEFQEEVKVGRYVSSSDLSQTLDDIHALFD